MWIYVCQGCRDNLPDLVLEMIPDTFLKGIIFVSFLPSPQRSDMCVQDTLDQLKMHLNQHNMHIESKLDGDLMSSFRTHVAIIMFQGNISVKALPFLIYCWNC